MPIKKIERILKNHCIPYYIENDRIYADSMIAGTAVFEDVEDVTDWTSDDLASWLGY